jgi:hypothetical protein
MSSMVRRIAAVVSVLLLAAVGSATLAPMAAAASPTAAASAYLTGTLVNGDHLTNSFGDDYGLTADLAIALAAADDQDVTLAKVVKYLAAHVADYADPAGANTAFPGPYSGAVGKLALVAEITGQDPHGFGGFDLLQTLTDNVCTGPNASCGAAGDFFGAFSTISQSLAVLALARGGITPPAATITRLTGMQCPDGGFSTDLFSATCSSEVDTTGYAVQALSLVAGVGSVVGNGRSYLLAAQQADGGFNGAAAENANSTGLATQGLLMTGTGAQPQVNAAVTFLLGLQGADGGFAINASTPGSDVRSTTQALPAVAGAVLTTLSDAVTLPTQTPTPTVTATASTSHTVRPSATTTSISSTPVGIAGGASGSGGELAATGSHTRQPLLAGVLLILAGCAALRLGRRPGQARRH